MLFSLKPLKVRKHKGNNINAIRPGPLTWPHYGMFLFTATITTAPLQQQPPQQQQIIVILEDSMGTPLIMEKIHAIITPFIERRYNDNYMYNNKINNLNWF